MAKKTTKKELGKMETLVMAIDSGKKNIKGKTGDVVLVYDNKINEEHTPVPQQFSYNVTYKDEQFTVGSGATDRDFKEGKGNKKHLIQTLTCVSQLLTAENKHLKDNIMLVYNESLNAYKIPSNRVAIKTLFKGEHSIEVNGEFKEFTIDRVLVVPEGYGYVLSNINDFLKGVYYIIDIGGKTMNFLTIQNGVVVLEKSFSYSLGMHIATSEIHSKLLGLGYGVQLEMVEDYMEEGTSDEKIIQAINESYENQLDALISNLNKLDIDLTEASKRGVVHFVGGGSTRMESVIKFKFGNQVKVAPNAIFSNVIGNYEYGVALASEE